MFRLPVCPHCGTVYRYKEVWDAVRKKEDICYHCDEGFKAKLFPHILAEIAILAAICIAINIAILSRMKELSLIPLFAVTIVNVLIGIALAPYFTRFVKTGKKK